MKKLGLMPMIVAVMLASTTLAPAQNSGTEPENKGNTGWTGGAKDQPTQEHSGGSPNGATTTGQAPADPAKAAEAARDAESAKTQPLMATGLDLKGPPMRYPASKTPE